MQRYDRTHYIALGLPSLLNATLIIYALDLSTDSWPKDYAARFYWVLAGGLGLFGATAMIKRARDMGSSAWGILLGFLFAPPFMLLVALVLSFVPSHPDADLLEPPPPPIARKVWFASLALSTLPWLAILSLQAMTINSGQ